mmetsp:Transcript_176628/g.566359  ORF Transcript_176628/g.566359 Transcript_176628/m.566359 type:complete len:341 (+) Transcript_176628:181-1203(+)
MSTLAGGAKRPSSSPGGARIGVTQGGGKTLNLGAAAAAAAARPGQPGAAEAVVREPRSRGKFGAPAWQPAVLPAVTLPGVVPKMGVVCARACGEPGARGGGGGGGACVASRDPRVAKVLLVAIMFAPCASLDLSCGMMTFNDPAVHTDTPLGELSGGGGKSLFNSGTSRGGLRGGKSGGAAVGIATFGAALGAMRAKLPGGSKPGGTAAPNNTGERAGAGVLGARATACTSKPGGPKRPGGDVGATRYEVAEELVVDTGVASENGVAGAGVCGTDVGGDMSSAVPRRELPWPRQPRPRLRLSCGMWQKTQLSPFWQRPLAKKQQRLQAPAACAAEPKEGN